MSVDTGIALLAAATALIGAITALIVQLRALRRDLNGRMEQLIAEATTAAHKVGELEGRDFMARLNNPPPDSAEGVPEPW